ncbi:sarcosine oxidase-like protein [Xylariaceae sp. FL1272]|nr:sarcosine oxidase-like protein [Xylariaceae sp. FL1272]
MLSSQIRDDSYIIVGAGVCGTSVAHHLISKYPKADVVLIDRGPYPHEAGASWDWNKAVRADYTNILYMKLALEALTYWRSDELYSEYYHQTGQAWVNNKGLSKAIIDNYEKLNATEKYHLLTPEDAKTRWGGIHSDADYDDATDIFFNESSGWVEATKTLKKIIRSAIDAGVRYVAADVKEVVFDDSGSTIGVRTADNNKMLAAHVILATGAYTPKLLMDSAPERTEIHAGHRVVAAGVSSGSIFLDGGATELYRQGPCFVSGVGDTLGLAMPPNSENRVKFTRDVSFTNTIRHERSGQNVSVPPDGNDYDQWQLSPGMKRELRQVCHGIYGSVSDDWELKDYRICWDAITPNQDQIICEHPRSRHLYIATGGSFHSWKFLPILGKYVIQMIEGTLDAELVKTWAWDRDDKGSAHEALLPHREMRDV